MSNIKSQTDEAIENIEVISIPLECPQKRLETLLRYSGLIDSSEPDWAIAQLAQRILQEICPDFSRPN